MNNKEISVGSIVKVRIQDGENSERIWSKVLKVNEPEQKIDVELMNNPVSPAFKRGEVIENLPVSFVLAVFEELEK